MHGQYCERSSLGEEIGLFLYCLETFLSAWPVVGDELGEFSSNPLSTFRSNSLAVRQAIKSCRSSRRMDCLFTCLCSTSLPLCILRVPNNHVSNPLGVLVRSASVRCLAGYGLRARRAPLVFRRRWTDGPSPSFLNRGPCSVARE